MLSRIHIIRHGITAGNLKNLMYSNTDLPLLKMGVEEIAELAALNAYPVPENASYYTSGLLRTEQTLALIYGEVEHEKIWDLREMEFGKYENRTFSELNEDPEYIEGVRTVIRKLDEWNEINWGTTQLSEESREFVRRYR